MKKIRLYLIIFALMLSGITAHSAQAECPLVSIDTTPLPMGTFNQPYPAYQVKPTGLSYNPVSESGLNLNSAGVITGKPIVVGSISLPVTAKNSCGNSTTITLPIQVMADVNTNGIKPSIEDGDHDTTPGDLLSVYGSGFGNERGSMFLRLGTKEYPLTINVWKEDRASGLGSVKGTVPDISGELDYSNAYVYIKKHGGAESNHWRPISFTATRELKTLSVSDVKVVECQSNSSDTAQICGTDDDGSTFCKFHCNYAPELIALGAISGDHWTSCNFATLLIHALSFGSIAIPPCPVGIGDSDIFNLPELKNGWIFDGITRTLYYQGGSGVVGVSLDEPIGLTRGSSTSAGVKINFNLGYGNHSGISYAFDVYIKGPRGIPYK